MDEMDRELRELLQRKVDQAAPPLGVPAGLVRRVRRRRAGTALATALVSGGLVFGGFVGVRAGLEAVGSGEIRPVPAGTPQVGPTAPTPGPTSSVRPESNKLHCDGTGGGSDEVFPDFVRAEALGYPDSETGELFDYVIFRFKRQDDPRKPPRYFVSYVDELTTDGEGAPVDVRGEAFLQISFQARGVELSGETPKPIYTGPKELPTESRLLTLVEEVQQIGDFEGMVSWGIGLSRKSCFYVEATPIDLAIVFPTGVYA